MNDGESREGDSTGTSETPLHKLQNRQALIRDRVIGAADRVYPGLFLHGPYGGGKTHQVRETLKGHGVNFIYHRGHLTPLGLFELLADHPDRVVVLDDVHVLFEQPVAQQILMAALGDMDEDGARTIVYRRQNREEQIDFTGSLICISNLDLIAESGSRAPVLEALRSRVHVLQYAPTEEEMLALMRHVVRDGWRSPAGGRKLTVGECQQVVEFVIQECSRLKHRPELRMLLEKALPDFWHWSQGETESHWEDLVRSSLEEAIIQPRHELRRHVPLSRASRKEREQAIVADLLETCDSAAERIRQFAERTGKDRRTYYRRQKELEESGYLMDQEAETESDEWDDML